MGKNNDKEKILTKEEFEKQIKDIETYMNINKMDISSTIKVPISKKNFPTIQKKITYQE